MKYPYACPDVVQADIDLVAAAMRGQFLTQGPRLAEFEVALADKFGVRHVVVCNSGTAALHLVYMALGLGPQAGLVTSPITFVATANAARMCGAPVAFADTDPQTGNLTPETAERALGAAPFDVGVLTAVHLGGRPCDMPALKAIAERTGCALIEDACHAPLAAYQDDSGEPFTVGACAHSDAAVFSFHAIKHLAMGEGGAVCTNDDMIADKARRLRNHGLSRSPEDWQYPPEPDAPWYYEMQVLGWNYRACELQCALGLSQLARLDDGIVRRQVIAAAYRERLAGLPYVATPPEASVMGGHVWHLYAIAADFDAIGRTRGQVMRTLAARGIGTQVHYIPVYRQPYYAGAAPGSYPGAEAYYASTLSIPMYPRLTERDLDEIVAALEQALAA